MLKVFFLKFEPTVRNGSENYDFFLLKLTYCIFYVFLVNFKVTLCIWELYLLHEIN